MKQELQQKLYTKYPKIFSQNTLPMTETAMCWNFQCDDGWYDLIDNLCHDIQEYIDKNNVKQIEATTVKEKFGGLRFYTDHADEHIYKLIEEAERKSFEICEHCGSTKDVSQTTGWIVTLCKPCKTEYRKKRFNE